MNPIWRPFGLKPNEKPTDETGPRYADLYARSLAAAADLIIMYALFHRLFDYITIKMYAPINRGILAQINEHMKMGEVLELLWQSQLPQYWLLNSLIQVALLGIVYIGCQWITDSTPGKYILGLRVVKKDSFEKTSKWQYALRYFAYIPAALPLMIGIIWMSFNKRHRGWHDMIARTVVIETRPRGWTWMQLKRGYRWLRDRNKSVKITKPGD